ncbi:MAG: helix-turn-helix domain-containing protein [Candidatus Altiarchaeota archaeon]
MKPYLLRRVAELLESSGFLVSDCQGSRSCFDFLARKGRVLLVVKVLNNIEGLNGNTVHELKKVSSLVGGAPIVVGARLKSSKLIDGVLYERYGINALNLSTMEDFVSDFMPVVHSVRGNYCSKIDSGLLRRLRSRLDLTQEELAKELGVSKQSVYRYESTGRVVFDVMEKMMKIFADERLLLHENLLSLNFPEEDSYFSMHVPGMRKIVADRLERIGFSTSITNAPFDVVAREHETVYTVVSDDNRRLEHKISLVGEITGMVGGYGMCVTNRHVSSRRGVAVLKPEELDGFESPKDLIERILD